MLDGRRGAGEIEGVDGMLNPRLCGSCNQFMRVTSDTNVVGPIAAPKEYSELESQRPAIGLIRGQIAGGQIEPYLSEASLSLEALPREARLNEFFRSWAMDDPVKLPLSSPVRQNVFEQAFALGFKVLRVPRIALKALLEIPARSWAPDAIYPQNERQERFSQFVRALPEDRLEHLKRLGTELAKTHNLQPNQEVAKKLGTTVAEASLWIRGLIAEFDHPLKFSTQKRYVNEVRDLVAEWFDQDILASHYAYGLDYFCTMDEAGNAGSTGILSSTQRGQVEAQSAIKIVAPEELEAMASGRGSAT